MKLRGASGFIIAVDRASFFASSATCAISPDSNIACRIACMSLPNALAIASSTKPSTTPTRSSPVAILIRYFASMGEELAEVQSGSSFLPLRPQSQLHQQFFLVDHVDLEATVAGPQVGFAPSWKLHIQQAHPCRHALSKSPVSLLAPDVRFLKATALSY